MDRWRPSKSYSTEELSKIWLGKLILSIIMDVYSVIAQMIIEVFVIVNMMLQSWQLDLSRVTIKSLCVSQTQTRSRTWTGTRAQTRTLIEVNFLHMDGPHHLIQNIADYREGPLGAAKRENHVEIVELFEAALATSGELQALCVWAKLCLHKICNWD